ncbi:MAG: nicotinamide mononucleotide transporter [Calditrichaeota bacterium]|nr:nicotinamide mononucleotide transporter [Calditrichota bacterium]
MSEILDAIAAMNLVEIIGTIFGFYAVVLMIRQHILCWPIGIANAALYTIMFYQNRLYSDMILHICYILLFAYGWYEWLHGGENKGELKISQTTTTEYIICLILAVTGVFGLGFYFNNYTDADLAYWDAGTTVFSLIAQWMLAKKLIENWILWFIIDVVASVLYVYKGLYWTATLFFLYLILAVIGYLEWQKQIQVINER